MALGYSCTVTVKPLLAGTLALQRFVLALYNIRKAQIALCPAPTGSDSSPCCSQSRRSTYRFGGITTSAPTHFRRRRDRRSWGMLAKLCQ